MRAPRRDDAVSPVIATILMVAITVVLTGVLYIWISNLSKDTGTDIPKLNVKFSDDNGLNIPDGSNFTGGDRLVTLEQTGGLEIEWGPMSDYVVLAEGEADDRHPLSAVEHLAGSGTRTNPGSNPYVDFVDAAGDASWAADGEVLTMYIYKDNEQVAIIGRYTLTLD